MQIKTLGYKYLRSAFLLLGVFCLFLICYSNFSTAAQPAKIASVTSKISCKGAPELIQDNIPEGNHKSHISLVKRRHHIVRGCFERFFLKDRSANLFAGDALSFNDGYLNNQTFYTPAYLLRPSYYVLLFLYALF